MDAATQRLAIVVAGCLLPAAIWLLVPLHDRLLRGYHDAMEAIGWILFGSFATFAWRGDFDDYRGADAD